MSYMSYFSTLITTHLDFCHQAMEIKYFRVGRKLRDHLVLPSHRIEEEKEA